MKKLKLVVVTGMILTLCLAAVTQAGEMETYIVLYNAEAVPVDAANTVALAGGTLVHSYNDIGVAIARSDNASFRVNLLQDKLVENISSTARFGVQAYSF